MLHPRLHLASLGCMGQETQGWMRRNHPGSIEMICEGDGNFSLRSAMNRDRTLRLTAAELESLIAMVVMPKDNVPAPEKAGRHV